LCPVRIIDGKVENYALNCLPVNTIRVSLCQFTTKKALPLGTNEGTANVSLNTSLLSMLEHEKGAKVFGNNT